MTIPLLSPIDDTRQLAKVALWGLKRIYKRNYYYAKAGVMLSELVSTKEVQQDLFGANHASTRTSDLMNMLDAINKKMGRDSIKLASEGFKRQWKMKQDNKSPNYTTDWNGTPKAN